MACHFGILVLARFPQLRQGDAAQAKEFFRGILADCELLIAEVGNQGDDLSAA